MPQSYDVGLIWLLLVLPGVSACTWPRMMIMIIRTVAMIFEGQLHNQTLHVCLRSIYHTDKASRLTTFVYQMAVPISWSPQCGWWGLVFTQNVFCTVSDFRIASTAAFFHNHVHLRSIYMYALCTCSCCVCSEPSTCTQCIAGYYPHTIHFHYWHNYRRTGLNCVV